MAPKSKSKKKKKAAEGADQELIFTDLRDWSAGRMAASSFGRWVEQNKLLCFNFRIEAGNTAFPFPQGEEVMWWPDLCLTPGSRFALDSYLHVDHPSTNYDRFREPLIRKEEERRRALGLMTVEEEASAEAHGSYDDFKHTEAAGVKTATEQDLVQMVVYRDLRKEAHNLRAPKVLEMGRDLFVAMVQEENLLCFNLSAYKEVYPHDSTAAATPASQEVPQIWFPHMKPEECKEFVFRGLVFVDEILQKYEILVKTYLPLHGSSKDVAKGFQKSLRSLVSFSVGRQAGGEEEEKDEKGDGDVAWEEEEDENEWQDIVTKKGKHKSVKELLIMMMTQQDHKFKSLSSKIDEVTTSLSSKIDEVTTSLSSLAERAVRSNFSLFIQVQHPQCSILQPLTRLKLTYNEKPSLEHLALLCGKGERNLMRHMPKAVEIDMFVRIKILDSQDPLEPVSRASPLRMTGPRSGSATSIFTHLAVAEVTRTMSLCNEWQNYQHPAQRECTRSSKLLYKLVQLERDIVACLNHFGASLSVVIGACVISPSFRDLPKPEGLLAAVLSKCPHGLENLQTLNERGQLWLMDV